VTSAILVFGAEPDAIRERGLESVIVTAHDIQVPVRDHACQMLPYALPHDSRLPVIYTETFLNQNCSGVRSKSLDDSLESFASGKRKIVSISRVGGAGSPRQSSQTTVRTIRT
jgi:hypothetical protein